MQKEYLNITESYLERIIHISLFLYLFLLIFPHTTTPKEIAFWAAFLCWVVLRFKNPESFIGLKPARFFSNVVNPIIASLSLFMFIAFISSIIGMEPLENLKRFKGELLVPFFLFLIAATELSDIEKVKRLLFAPVIAFAVYTLLAVAESTNYGLHYFWDKSGREKYIWLTNYSQTGAIVFPLILGLFLFAKNRWFKYSLAAFAFLEFMILAAYRSLTPLLGVITVLLLWVAFVRPKRYRLWMVGFICLFVSVSVLLFYTHKNNPAVNELSAKFEKLFNISGEFTSEGGFSNRMPAWIAAVDIIKERPILGYGWGIKKFEKLVYQKKFLEKWKESKPSVYEFYTVNMKNSFFPPHNLFLEIAVQSGILGITTFICFIGIYLYFLVKNIKIINSDAEHNFSVILIGGTFLSFMIMNLMNNDLGNVSGKILFVALGSGA
ncbi:MAG: hypothetical protein A2W05_09520, partial [Candidatus Schekmanbacteria bacterium RBG_16_38_10]